MNTGEIKQLLNGVIQVAQPGLTYEVDDSEVQARTKRMLARLNDLTPAMEIIGEIGVASMQKNFEEGGRPTTWQGLADSTKAQREKTKTWPGQILVKSGALKKITYEAEARKVTFMPPADLKYAAIHHFGGEAGKDHKVTIPARPYLMLQDEDQIEIVAVLDEFVMEQDG